MGLRRSTIATRIALALVIPVAAIVAMLSIRIHEASVRRDAAQAELEAIAALETLTDVQANMHLVNLIEVRRAVDEAAGSSSAEQRLLVGATLDAAWDLYMPVYLDADDGRRTQGADLERVIGARAMDAYERQRLVVDEIILLLDAGDEIDAGTQTGLRETRLAADLALTDVALAADTTAWATYPATVEVSRATAMEFSHLVPTLLGVRIVDVAGLAMMDGRRANATERVVYNLSAERRAEVQAIFASSDYDVWTEARDDALAILAGERETWSLTEVARFSETAIALGDQIDVVTARVVADVRDAADARVEAEAAQERSLAIAIVVIGVISGAATLRLLNSIRRPLKALTDRTAAVARGELDGDAILVEGRDELSDLARVVEDVAEAMTQLDQQVRAISAGQLDDPALDHSAPGAFGTFVAERVQHLRIANGALAQEAHRDPLTGLANRRGLEAAVGMLDPTVPSVVLFIDLDRFKSVNDDFGHRHGDAVLREVAARIGAASRERDIAARLGGDEFVLVAVGAADATVADDVARRLEASIRRPIEVDEVAHHIGCSIGVAWIDPAEEFGVTLERADLAMIAVKRRHREQGASRGVRR